MESKVKTKERITSSLIVLISLGFLAGCAIIKRDKPPTDGSLEFIELPMHELNLMRQAGPDIVNTVLRLGDYIAGPIKIEGSNPLINDYVSQKLLDAGQRLTNSSGNDQLMNIEISQSGDITRMLTHYRFLKITREYRSGADGLVPLSATKVTATTQRPVPITRIAKAVSVGQPEPLEPVGSSQWQSMENQAIEPESMTKTEAASVPGETLPLVSKSPTPGHSRYDDVFGQYYDIEQHTLIFPNDSLRLGSDNKRKIMSLADRINPKTDIVSVVGCSFGQTTIKNGNQILAQGRTNRVAESFMFAGLDPNIVLDEACWSSKYFDELAPRRGVMITHKRRVGS